MAVDLKSEIEVLRGQIEALTKQIATDAKAPDATAPDAADEPNARPSIFESEAAGRVKEQLDEFVELVEKQLQEIPAGTAIGIFALGVLLGRLLPR